MGYRQYVNRHLVGNNNGEIVNKFNWDLIINKPPAAIYWPDNIVFYNRLKDVSGLPDDTSAVEDVEVGGGFTVIQTGDSHRPPVEVTFNFQEYDDNVIGKLINSWKRACQDPYTGRSTPKALLVCDMTAIQLNTNLIPIKQWRLYNGIISSGSTGDEAFTNKKEVGGQTTMTIKFEWWDIDWLR